MEGWLLAKTLDSMETTMKEYTDSLRTFNSNHAPTTPEDAPEWWDSKPAEGGDVLELSEKPGGKVPEKDESSEED